MAENSRSMRYSMDEVLSGILATFERDTFTDDAQKLGETFKGLSQQAPLFAPFGAIAEGGISPRLWRRRWAASSLRDS